MDEKGITIPQSKPEQYQYKIYAAIRQNLRTCRSLGELEQRLIPLGIEMSYKYKGQTKEKQGVSFRLGEYCFKGSQIDRKFSYANLEKAVSLNQRQSLLRPYPEKPLVSFSGYANSNLEKSKDLARTVTKKMHMALEMLLKQEQAIEQIPYELSHEAKGNSSGSDSILGSADNLPNIFLKTSYNGTPHY